MLSDDRSPVHPEFRRGRRSVEIGPSALDPGNTDGRQALARNEVAEMALKLMAPKFLPRGIAIAVVGISAFFGSLAPTLAADKVTFLTSWFAQAEHGGFYQ